MAARDVQTNLTIALQTKGFDKGLRGMLGMSQKSIDGLKKQAVAGAKVQTQIDQMQRKVQELTKTQLDANRAMEKISDKTGAAYRHQTERLDKARQETERLRKEVQLLERAHVNDLYAQKKLGDATQRLNQLRERERRESRWAATQGFMQGAGMGGMAGMFMQRGPGFWRQAAGQWAGGMVRRAGGAAQGLAFGGIQGLQTALQAIPGGGVVAGQLGAVAAHSQQALQWQRQQLQLAPMFASDTGAVQQAQQRLAQAQTVRRAVTRQGRADKEEGVARYQRGAYAAGALLGGIPGISEERAAEMGGLAAVQHRRSQRETRVAIAAQMEAQARQQVRQAQTAPFQTAGQIGRKLAGLGRQESAQLVGQLYQAAGGQFGRGAGAQRDVKAAVAAQTMFGVGPEVSGAYMMAGRRGGLVGGRGGAAESLTGALRDALEMGLEGSEITRYLQTTAQGIQQFQQTGIPFNKDSIKSMTLEMGKSGIGGVRGGASAGGIQRYVQTIGQRGIGSGLDLMLMQQFGGFQGGGPQAFEQAMLQMESLQGKGGGAIEAGTPMGEMFRRLIEMGGGAQGGGVTFARRAMGRMGVQMSLGETMAVTERITGQQLLTPEQRAAVGVDVAGEARRRMTGVTEAGKLASVDQLLAAAAKRVTDIAPNLRKQAAIMDQQLAVGSKALTAVQNLEQSSLNLNDTFMMIAGPTLNNFSAAMNDVTKELGELVKEHGLLVAIRKMVIGI